MDEIIFIIEESKEGGFEARALDHSIFTEAEDMESLKDAVKDAVLCHFDKEDMPKIIRLHLVKDELISV
ncbi:MAG: 2-oxoisovalerate dehydrogenase [Actinobacteria bacterium]|nr:2-oxoisovalerate dehydrogenase [Actinomycetota bacterium]MCL5070578.1 2-oxoisovalerate dehydrogenase [Actinomycetota bacterium]